jgi:hypothetical protein
MKTTWKFHLLLTLVATSFALSVRAQNTNASTNTTPPPPPPGAPAQHGSGPLANLSEADRKKVKAAHDAAIQKDPSLEQGMKNARQAMEKARKAMHDAMIAVDPSVAPILATMTKPSGENGPRPWKHDGAGQGMANLTESEREQLKAAHEKVKNDPVVIAARQAKQSANTPEARHAAEEALHKASREAMVKADPLIAPILDKLHPPGPGGFVEGAPQTNAESMMQSQ